MSQIAATALMLVTMREQSFGVATAMMKTEPVTLALISAGVLSRAVTTAQGVLKRLTAAPTSRARDLGVGAFPISGVGERGVTVNNH